MFTSQYCCINYVTLLGIYVSSFLTDDLSRWENKNGFIRMCLYGLLYLFSVGSFCGLFGQWVCDNIRADEEHCDCGF